MEGQLLKPELGDQEQEAWENLQREDNHRERL